MATEQFINDRYKLLDRECHIINGLLTSGLENLRKIAKNKEYYYNGFYFYSIGLERLIKLILILENNSNVRRFGHKIRDLMVETTINFEVDSIESLLIDFFHEFSINDRYKVIDLLNDNSGPIGEEPINRFYNNILTAIIDRHPPRRIMFLSDEFNEFAFVSGFFIER